VGDRLFRSSSEEIISPSNEVLDDDDNPFSRDEDNDGVASQSVEVRVVNFVRENIVLPPLSTAAPVCLQTPVFMGHGQADEKVSAKLGEEGTATLRSLGRDVTWNSYEELGHWYKVPDEIVRSLE